MTTSRPRTSSMRSGASRLPTTDDRRGRDQDVQKWFGKLHVLKGVSLTVKRQEVVVIIGASGSGKTTFIRCVNHLEKIQKRPDLRERPPHRLPRGRRQADRGQGENIASQREEIGMVFQRFNLFPHMTALENVVQAPIRVRGVPEAEA